MRSVCLPLLSFCVNFQVISYLLQKITQLTLADILCDSENDGKLWGSDKVDVVAARLLQFDHDPGHVGRGGGFAPAQMADVIILTEDAPEVTVGQEDGP